MLGNRTKGFDSNTCCSMLVTSYPTMWVIWPQRGEEISDFYLRCVFVRLNCSKIRACSMKLGIWIGDWRQNMVTASSPCHLRNHPHPKYNPFFFFTIFNCSPNWSFLHRWQTFPSRVRPPESRSTGWRTATAFPWCWWATRVTWAHAPSRRDKRRNWPEATACPLSRPRPKPDRYASATPLSAFPLCGPDPILHLRSRAGRGGSVLFARERDQKIQRDQPQQQKEQEEHSETLHDIIAMRAV